ncbi:MAG: hypothetical protein M9939_26595 [Mesorhizobium sp.]|nr:hypothetical protein [Mesorhizobium sp.]MCO5164663.1 hypothetical protein [Mesorhizobium sp.]
MLSIGSELPDPLAQHVLVEIQITGSLRNSNASILHQPHRLKFELAAELPSLHSHSPVPSNTLSRCPRNRQQANGLRYLTGGKLDLSNLKALGAAFGLLMAVIAPVPTALFAAYLLFDDLLALFEGGPSVIGALIDKLPELTAAFDEIAPGVRSAIQSAIALAKEGDWTGAGIMAAEAYARGWNALTSLVQPYIDQALAYLESVDWAGAINRGVSKASITLNSVNWGDVGAEGGRVGSALAASLVASLAKDLHGASVAIGNVLRGELKDVKLWEGGVVNLIVDSLKAQGNLITGALAGITAEIRAAVLKWFDIDLHGAGARLAKSLWDGFKSYLPSWDEFLWGDAADPNFDPREHFRIENQINRDRPREIRPVARDRPILEDRATRERAGGSTSQRALDGMDKALQQIRAALSAVNGDNAGQKVQETIANDNRVLNQSNTVNAPVTVNATLTNATPGAIGAAAGAGVRSAGNSAVRSLAVTGLPSFGGPR